MEKGRVLCRMKKWLDGGGWWWWWWLEESKLLSEDMWSSSCFALSLAVLIELVEL